jgi:uncharacterized repeat protein (TIGR04138 family)
MSQKTHWLIQLVAKDPRYKPAAYEFLFEALEFTRARLAKSSGTKVKHISGRELLEGIRELAVQQFGFLAKTVFNQWGIYATSDFGNMVFNLVESGEMEKTDQDSRSDFDEVYDFEEVFEHNFRIELEQHGA